MRILPILFNTDMVRAILEERKTVTRRVVKPQHLLALGSPYHRKYPDIPDNIILEKRCHPPYIPGNILYVRETWGNYATYTNPDGADYFMYRADYPDGAATTTYPDGTVFDLPTWRPSIHMPKDAARIFLKVTGVRAERLWDITEEQARAEGAESKSGPMFLSDRSSFIALWDSTVKRTDRDKYGWAANPWVWVIEFERVDKPEGWMEVKT